MASFYTRGGDEGYTGVLGEGRVPKYDAVMEALGAVDEANAYLGVARTLCQSATSRALVIDVQRHLYGLMAEVAATPENAGRFHTIEAGHVTWLEEQTDAIQRQAPTPKDFILPGDTPAGAALDVARAVTRRAERRVVELAHKGWVQNGELLRYLNRLSSLIFVLEIFENQLAGYDQSTLAKDNG
jgi:cob(I)alamin adenosyltransferase